MKRRELMNLGVPGGATVKLAIRAVAQAARSGMKKDALRSAVQAVVEDPASRVDDPHFGRLARALAERGDEPSSFEPRAEPAPWRQWGSGFEGEAVRQMEDACRLPVAVAGALMPDAHVGYGLPIGGVLAVRDAVIPYAVGVDIACRMKMTVLDMPVSRLEGWKDRLANAIAKETRFGVGAAFKSRRAHDVMDADWSFCAVTREVKDRAWAQLGTSGSGNHFVEFGTLTLERDDLGLDAGVYVALLSHSGSRGPGALVAQRYCRLAADLRRDLPKELRRLAWLDLDSEAGREYWRAMELMGRYAAANHELIHRHIARNLRLDVLLDVENHHNFAWKETFEGQEVVVHRKGATPAEKGVLGVIPGSMATPGFVVRGKGEPLSLRSAAHGAGRTMSRKAAKSSLTWSAAKKFLAERGVTLLSAGLDEVPMVYKDIEKVMAAQADLVEPVARFDPKLVKMAPGGERPED
jgi:tRNA-splicing ligase RtcB